MVTREPRTPESNPEAGTNPGPSGQAGFTIVEVIISVVILAVGLLGMAGSTILVVQQTALSDSARARIKRCVKREATYLSAEEVSLTSKARVGARGKGTSPHEEGYRRRGPGVHRTDV